MRKRRARAQLAAVPLSARLDAAEAALGGGRFSSRDVLSSSSAVSLRRDDRDGLVREMTFVPKAKMDRRGRVRDGIVGAADGRKQDRKDALADNVTGAEEVPGADGKSSRQSKSKARGRMPGDSGRKRG